MVSACPEAAAPVASDPPAEARSQRLAKFKREQVVVDTLNRGVSVAEIAARVGVGEKRMRAIIRDPRTGIRRLARRMPHPPEPPDPSPGVVAIQLSRLNEALLVAFSDMTGANLKAVDQAVKIVRELDRYGGAHAAEWARPEVSPRIISESQPGDPGLDAGEESPAFGAALFCSADLGLQDDEAVSAKLGRGDRPENPAQTVEKVESAPRVSTPVAALPPGRSPGVGDAVDDRVDKVAGADGRPENPAQTLEKVDSAPGIAPDPQFSTVTTGRNLLRDATPCVAPQHEGGKRPSAAAAAHNRPEILLQAVEKVDSAPGEIEASRRRRPPRPPRALDPGIAGTTGAPGAKFPAGGRRPEPRRSPEGVHGGPLRRLSSRYPTTCIVSHVAASAGLCRPSISTLTS